jgi:tetratricopeptide (TPR) repeat protein
MTREESLTLLFNRTHLVPANDREQRAAEDIAVGLDYLPLSLELAGAYIQTERVTYDDYWKAYLQTAPSKERVETTLLVSFSKLKKPANQLAKLCSFFSADEIPFQLLRKSIDLLPEFNKDTPSFDWMTDIVGVLIAHSLVRSDVSSQTCSMHRYIQTGLRHLMDKEEQRLWAERAVKVTSQLFSLSIADWSQRERLLPTAFVAADLIENWDLESKEAAALLAALGTYLNERAQFTRAEPLLRRALRLTSRTEDRSSEVVILGALAGLYYEQGRYNEATSFINQALNFQETLVGPDDPEIAKTLRSLAQVNAQKGNYEEAQSILLRSLQIQIGHNSEPREIVETLNLLAWTYFEQKKYADAEHHFRFALEVGENALASKNPAVARSLRGLARSYLAEAKYEEAKSAYERLISIKAPQPDSEFAASLTELAYIYINERDYLEAKSLLERALAIQQQMGLMGQVANTLNNLALIYSHEGRYEEAERNLKHALDIQERVFGLGNASVVRTWENYAAILRQLGRDEEARVFEERAKRIRPRQTAIN